MKYLFLDIFFYDSLSVYKCQKGARTSDNLNTISPFIIEMEEKIQNRKTNTFTDNEITGGYFLESIFY